MNYIFGCMLIAGFIFYMLQGNLSSYADVIMNSSTDAVTFVLGLTGILCLWSGLMNIAEKTGLINCFARISAPIMHYLFPEEKNQNILATILMSFTANIFGAGNSATIFSLKAMQMMDDENNHSHIASSTMCMFMAVSMSMIQIAPVVLLKIRQDLGSSEPSSIILPSVLSGLLSMFASIVVCKYFERKPYT